MHTVIKLTQAIMFAILLYFPFKLCHTTHSYDMCLWYVVLNKQLIEAVLSLSRASFSAAKSVIEIKGQLKKEIDSERVNMLTVVCLIEWVVSEFIAIAYGTDLEGREKQEANESTRPRNDTVNAKITLRIHFVHHAIPQFRSANFNRRIQK